jgi:hypothetical protein
LKFPHISTFFLIEVFVFSIFGGYMSEGLFITAGHLLPLLALLARGVYGKASFF